MKISLLRSGSSGNCIHIEHNDTEVLLDGASSSLLKLEEILADAGRTPSKIKAVVVSHVHGDHINTSTLRLCAKYQIPIRAHSANVQFLKQLAKHHGKGHLVITPFDTPSFSIGSLHFSAFDVPHDATGITSGFRCWTNDNETRYFAYAADLGEFSDDLVPHFANAAAVILESNHDVKMLMANPRRHESNKHRVLGVFGHLSNEQCADALVRVFKGSSTHPSLVILAHLSGDHNTPEIAHQVISSSLAANGFNPVVHCASRKSKTEFYDLDNLGNCSHPA